MRKLLLITDDPRHAARLARSLDDPQDCHIHDLYDTKPPQGRTSLIVSDIRDLTSDALVRLRRCLEAVRDDGSAHILLVHGHAARAEMQARLIGAETLPAATAMRLLPARVRMGAGSATFVSASRDPASPSARRHAGEASRFLSEVFFAGAAMTPSLSDTGTDLITEAIRDTGVADWVRAVQRFDDMTHQHILLVAGLSAGFGLALQLNRGDRHRLTRAALLHDIGKTRIPAAILNKPGRLDPDEMQVMRTHASIGHAMLAGADFDPMTLTVVRSHHEMLDGSGYPDGLRGDGIPDLVRLVTISDIYAALIERRPYKSAMPEAKAMAIIRSMAGRLDADLVRAFQPVADAFHTGSVPPAAHSSGLTGAMA